MNVPVIKQKEIDDCRTQEERNRLGQFSTPFDLARDIVKHSLHFHGNRDICFLEPALGTGVFFGAIEAGADKERIKQASGIELDAGYSSIASELWPDAPFRVINQNFLDFTKLPENRGTFSLLCTDPPYVRHHHIPSAVKSVLQGRVRSELGLNPSGLSGLYVYFILLSHHLLAPNAVASWLIPSEFLSVNYGRVLREYLLRRVTLTHIHQFDPADVQFNDAMEELLDCLNNLKKQVLINGGRTYGGGLHKLEPSELASLPMPRLPEWLQTPKQAELIFS
ncbi:Eco57I restriction-modification methylase domain-containing protein [Candidatus Thiosymbion oneisti]|uniref:Eco57I restriction-modification methylase domain-containing protein n=1 Tax=Candidatus Thiosymbion oneisti TaxID=589554 RepID=UPI000A4CD7C3|nr:hypothetical protein [Candidatus Thiosymbion oneisti]